LEKARGNTKRHKTEPLTVNLRVVEDFESLTEMKLKSLISLAEPEKKRYEEERESEVETDSHQRIPRR
jgi:hypothetical protein